MHSEFKSRIGSLTSTTSAIILHKDKAKDKVISRSLGCARASCSCLLFAEEVRRHCFDVEWAGEGVLQNCSRERDSSEGWRPAPFRSQLRPGTSREWVSIAASQARRNRPPRRSSERAGSVVATSDGRSLQCPPKVLPSRRKRKRSL